MLASMLALGVVLGGCATTGGKVSAVIGLAAGAGAAATVYSARSCTGIDEGSCGVGPILVGGGFVLVAVAALVSGIVFESIGAAYDEPAAAAGGPSRIELARQATRAAHAGHCADANAFAQRLREVDSGFYERLIAADPPLAGCR